MLHTETLQLKCDVCWLGRTPYSEAYELQKKLNAERLSGSIPDTLLIVEHDPVLTIGKSGKTKNLLVSRKALEEKGVSLFFIDRGGDITYHGPGQLVAYPIFDLREHGKDAHVYIHNLEETVIRTVGDYGIKASRDDEHVGVWVGNEKIAAIGVSIRRWISMHGLALNVNTDMSYFSFINPCGITDRGVTSMAKLLSREIIFKEVARKLSGHFAEVFKLQCVLLSI